MSKPYVGRPSEFGIFVTTQGRLNEQVGESHQSEFQVGVHANGDKAIDMGASRVRTRTAAMALSRPTMAKQTQLNAE